MSEASEVKYFAWLREAPDAARKVLLAASLGWMLDAFDILLFALVLPAVMVSLHLSKARAGVLGSVTLVAAAVGGVLFGIAADRWGRVRVLTYCVIVYAVFTAACGLAWNFWSLACFRILLGFGMGGEWATGAAMVSEAWPAASRDKALGLMQSSFAVGFGLAALVSYVLMPLVGWRGVFFVGLLPAALTVWLRRRVQEPEVWSEGLRGAKGSRIGQLLGAELLPRTVVLTLMNACCLFAWWGFNLWVPSYLSLPVAKGGIGFSARTMTVIVVAMQVGMWLGYVSFGYLATALGRKRVYVGFLVSAAALLMLFGAVRSPWVLVGLGPCVAFAATGYFSGFAAVTADAYPSQIRATGQGFTYNVGRLASAAAPYLAGTMADRHGFGAAFHVDAMVFLVAAMFWLFC